MGNIQYKLSWNEYGQLIEDLWSDLSTKLDLHSTKVDALIMILREGGFTALPLAYKLNTYKVMTIQYKYMLHDGGNELKYIAGMPEVTYEVPASPTFLLCDTFPSGGETKTLAIAKIKEKYPDSKFVFASIIEDKTTSDISDILFSAYAVGVDSDWKTSHSIYRNAGVENVLYTLLPWENEAEELAGPDQKAWDYN